MVTGTPTAQLRTGHEEIFRILHIYTIHLAFTCAAAPKGNKTHSPTLPHASRPDPLPKWATQPPWVRVRREKKNNGE